MKRYLTNFKKNIYICGIEMEKHGIQENFTKKVLQQNRSNDF